MLLQYTTSTVNETTPTPPLSISHTHTHTHTHNIRCEDANLNSVFFFYFSLRTTRVSATNNGIFIAHEGYGYWQMTYTIQYTYQSHALMHTHRSFHGLLLLLLYCLQYGTPSLQLCTSPRDSGGKQSNVNKVYNSFI